MAAITRRPDRTLDWRELFPRLFDAFDTPETWFSPERSIRVEEFMDDGHLVVRADLPGVDPDKDVEVTVHDGLLDIRAERRQETTTEDKARVRSEFHYGMFTRTLQLPPGAGEGDVGASYHDGVLEVRVPVEETPAETTRTIPISRY
jgi:HSP20 family protein